MNPALDVTLDAVDAERAAAFWQAALGYERLYDRYPYVVLGPSSGMAGPRVLIQSVERVSSDKTPVHLDLRVEDRAAEVARLVALGATVRWEADDTEQGGGRWTTLADPQGILFCVVAERSS